MTGVINVRRDPYLSGVYAPVATERDDADLAITGHLPEALVGTYLRNGPNPMFEPKGRYHVFDGDGMVHGVTFGDGRASYRNRWVRTDGLAAEMRAGHAIYGGMADGDFPSPEETGGGPPMKNVANTNVLRHAGRILCLWEAGSATELGADLATIGAYDFGGAYGGPLTAHPKLDPVTGEMLAFGYSPFPPYLTYLVVAPDGSLVRTVPIELPAPVMMHDFAITDRHAVFLDAPAVFDVAAFASGEPMLAWKPELGTRFGVIDRDGGGHVTWVETDPCYVFHFLNAWSSPDGRTVTVDGCRLPRMDIGLDTEGGVADADSWPHRFTIDLESRRVRYEPIAGLPGDFPRVAPAVEGRAHRYGYYASFSSGVAAGGDFDSVTKLDVDAGSEATHVYGAATAAGEAVFAPDPARADAEDGGWLLNIVTDRITEQSDLVVLDAPTLEEVARVHFRARVPFGFHGNWLAAG